MQSYLCGHEWVCTAPQEEISGVVGVVKPKISIRAYGKGYKLTRLKLTVTEKCQFGSTPRPYQQGHSSFAIGLPFILFSFLLFQF